MFTEGLSSTTIPNPRESHPVPARHSQAYKKVQKAEPPSYVYYAGEIHHAAACIAKTGTGQLGPGHKQKR